MSIADAESELPKREAPMSVRIPSDLREQLEDYAEKNGVKLNRLCVILLREGLLQYMKPKKLTPPSSEPELVSKEADAAIAVAMDAPLQTAPPPRERSPGRRQTAGAAKGYCVHRIPLESFCAQCR